MLVAAGMPPICFKSRALKRHDNDNSPKAGAAELAGLLARDAADGVMRCSASAISGRRRRDTRRFGPISVNDLMLQIEDTYRAFASLFIGIRGGGDYRDISPHIPTPHSRASTPRARLGRCRVHFSHHLGGRHYQPDAE